MSRLADAKPLAARPGGLDPVVLSGYSSPVTLYLVRHGETRENAGRVVQLPDVPLSEHGLAQADQLGRRLASLGIVHVLTSDLARARMTADAITATTAASVALESLLRERDFGAVRGRSYDSLATDIFAPGYEPPGGESWLAFDARVDLAWQHIVDCVERTAGSVVVVTHGLVLAALAARHLSLPPGQDPPMRWGNTGVTIVDTGPPWRARVLDCRLHLSSIEGTGPVSTKV